MAQLAFARFAAAAFAVSLGYFLYVYLFQFGPPPAASGDPLPSTVAAHSASLQALSGPTLFNLALFTAFALHHSVFARTGAKDLIRRSVAPALERAVYTLVASILFLLVCGLWRVVPGEAWTLRGVWRWTGFAAQATGIVLTMIGARALDVWELAGVRQVMPSASRTPPSRTTLKTDGLYGFVRHPLYFAWVLLVFGAPDMTMTRLSFAAISTIYLALAIPFEERSLIETFGPDYASYRTKVRWRMIPGIY